MSWLSGVISIGIVCFVLSYTILKIKHTGLKIISIIFTPYVLSSITYWVLAHGSSQYGSWTGLVIETWSLSGLIGLLFGLLIFSKFGKENEKK